MRLAIVNDSKPQTPDDLLRSYLKANPNASKRQAKKFFGAAMLRNKRLADQGLADVLNQYIAEVGMEAALDATPEEIIKWMRRKRKKESL